MKNNPPFHLAFAVHDLELAREFYTDILGCAVGREDDQWIDFNFCGHQIVAHLSPKMAPINLGNSKNNVDGKQVPANHFGVVLDWQSWHDLKDRLTVKKIDFIIEPYIRFKDKKGEQATMFFQDPSKNAIEIKSFKDMSLLFEKF